MPPRRHCLYDKHSSCWSLGTRGIRVFLRRLPTEWSPFNSFDFHSIFRKVGIPTFRFIGEIRSTPTFALLKRWGIQVKCDSRLVLGAANFVVPYIVSNVGQSALIVRFIRDAWQLFVVPNFSNAPLLNLQPTAITWMIVDGRFLPSVPTQQQQRVVFVVRSNQVACVRFGLVEVSVSIPIFWCQFWLTATMMSRVVGFC